MNFLFVAGYVYLHMGKILFYIVYPLIWLLAWLPLPILYLFSDINYFILRYLVRYRKNVVEQNFLRSYPNLSAKERLRLENRYFRFLCDYAVETISLLHISEKEMKKRFRFTNIEVLLGLGEQNRNITAVFGHYCNWEWVSSLPLWVDGKITISTLYKPLSNKLFDQFFLKLRSRFGTRCIPKNNTLRAMLTMQKEDRPYVLAFIADQTPTRNNLHFWTQFLNQETPFLTGWETLVMKLDNALVYLNLKRVKRGYYTATFEIMEMDTRQCSEFELTERYVRRLEQTLEQDPSFWLWSHRRWKHKREEQTS